jgi:hypothetical protein
MRQPQVRLPEEGEAGARVRLIIQAFREAGGRSTPLPGVSDPLELEFA